MIIISRSTRSFTPLSITRHHRNHHGHLSRLTPSPRCHPSPSPPAASITQPLVTTYTTAGTTMTAVASSRCRRRGGDVGGGLATTAAVELMKLLISCPFSRAWGCPPPNHHRGGGRTTVQPPLPHLVVSGCDGATPSEASG
nr:hypothetical protein [Tanacetum cinerariifolium]